MFANPEELSATSRTRASKFVDVRFCDLPGVMQHFTVPVESFGEDVFTDGLAFDGSSIRGFQADPRVGHAAAARRRRPPSSTRSGWRRPLALNFFIHDPFTREAYCRDPRNVAKKAEAYLASSGIADTAYFGARGGVLHLRLDPARDRRQRGVLLHRLGRGLVEHRPRRATGGNRGYKTAYKGGYFPVPPFDHYADLRDPMVTNLIDARLHRRAGPPRGRHRRPGRDQLQVRHAAAAGDRMQLFKYIVKNTAWHAGKTRDVHAQAALR